MFRVHRGPKRWVNLPYAIVVGALLLLGLADESPLGGVLAYLVLLPLFVIQLARPTVAGWVTIVGSWFVLIFLNMLQTLGIAEYNNWALTLIGLAPLVPLYIFRPRMKAE